jgi:hypothetical protein
VEQQPAPSEAAALDSKVQSRSQKIKFSCRYIFGLPRRTIHDRTNIADPDPHQGHGSFSTYRTILFTFFIVDSGVEML